MTEIKFGLPELVEKVRDIIPGFAEGDEGDFQVKALASLPDGEKHRLILMCATFSSPGWREAQLVLSERLKSTTEEVLKLDPRDSDAVYNLVFSTREVAASVNLAPRMVWSVIGSYYQRALADAAREELEARAGKEEAALEI